MAYDTDLADRVRQLIDADAGVVTEKRMFGGLAFLVNGKLALAVSGQGKIMVRIDPAEFETLVVREGVDVVEMRGRTMSGWLRVAPDQLRTKRQLARWVDRAVGYAASLSD